MSEKKTGRASEDILAQLHGKVVAELIRRIESGDADAALINAARQMLKDNGINCDGSKSGDLLSLADTLDDGSSYPFDTQAG